MTAQNPEFEKFDTVMRKILSVPHKELVKREKKYQKQRKAKRQANAKRT